MDIVIDEIKTYPEVKKFVLVNLFTNQEKIVTHQQLEQAFGDQLPKIKSGRNPAWMVIDYYE